MVSFNTASESHSNKPLLTARPCLDLPLKAARPSFSVVLQLPALYSAANRPTYGHLGDGHDARLVRRRLDNHPKQHNQA